MAFVRALNVRCPSSHSLFHLLTQPCTFNPPVLGLKEMVMREIIWLLSFSICGSFFCLCVCMLNHPCIFERKPTWSLWIIFVMCSWIWFAYILLGIFESMFLKMLVYNFLLSSLCTTFYQGNSGFIKRISQCSFSSFLWVIWGLWC